MAHQESQEAGQPDSDRLQQIHQDIDEMEEIEPDLSNESESKSSYFDLDSNPISTGLLCGGGSAAFYLMLRTAIFYRNLKSIESDPTRSIRELDDFSSSVISVINASISSLMSLNVIRLQSWKNPVRSKPSILFLTYCSITGFMLADTVGKIACWSQFRGTINGWKLNKVMIFHHVLSSAAGAFQFPNPEYCMLLFGLFLAAESSSVPLGIMFIGKFTKKGSQFRRNCKIAFFICWMLTRVPLCFYALYYSVKYHREIMDQGKVRGIILGVGNTCGAVLQGLWTLLILKKFLRYLGEHGALKSA